MKLESGKFYLAGDGSKVGPVWPLSGFDNGRWFYCDGFSEVWNDDGKNRYSGIDLVAEWHDGTANDQVNHPPHYKAHPSGIECIQITEHMGFNLGNAVKYIWRCDLKSDAIEDLRKAEWYIQREIAKRVSACGGELAG